MTGLKSAAVGNDDAGFGVATCYGSVVNIAQMVKLTAGAVGLNLLDDVQTLDDLTEDDVGAVEPGGGDGGDEELRAVGVLASVGHRQLTGLGVLQLEVLVWTKTRFSLDRWHDRLAHGPSNFSP